MLCWSSMKIITPIFRCHEGNKPKENVQFNYPEVKDTFIKHSKVYASLKKYHEHVLNEYYKLGYPCSRPVFFHYDENWAYLDREVMMYGSDIIVYPITRSNVEKKKITLPQDEWVQFFTGQECNGGTIEIDTPLNRPIAFYKKNSKFAKLFKNIEL